MKVWEALGSSELKDISLLRQFLFPQLISRSQRAKMRFWVKGKQGDKKTPREKLATQSELLELYPEQEVPSREVAAGLQLGEGEWWVSRQQCVVVAQKLLLLSAQMKAVAVGSPDLHSH